MNDTLVEMATCAACMILMYVVFALYGNAKRQQLVSTKEDMARKELAEEAAAAKRV